MPEALLETVIGLFFVFVLLSLAASQIVEWVASYGRWRAKDLKHTIGRMLYDPTTQKNLDKNALVLVDRLYEHPLIASLAQPGSKPSYIPASTFAIALFDVIVTSGTEVSTIGRARLGLEQVKNHLLATLPSAAEIELTDLIKKVQMVIENAKAAGPNPETIAALSLPVSLNDELNGFYRRYSVSSSTVNALVQQLMSDNDLQLTQIINGVTQLAKTRPQLAQLITGLFSSMDTYISEGESRLSAARHTIEQWFDDTMDRARGGYKRSNQVWLGITGLVLACGLNVDTIAVATTLWRDPTLRQNALEQAQRYKLTGDSTSFSTVEEATQAINQLNLQLRQELQLPIGWRSELYELQPDESCVWLRQRERDVWGIPSQGGCLQILDAAGNQSSLFPKLLGLLLTALAVSQGGPFWFDLLSKATNLRGSGAVPATAQENARARKAKNTLTAM